MCTRSGELVIISRGKLHSKIKDKIKSLRFYVIVMIMCAAILPGAVAYFGVIKAYEARAVSLQTAEIQNQCTILCDQLASYHYLEERSSEVINAGSDADDQYLQWQSDDHQQ